MEQGLDEALTETVMHASYLGQDGYATPLFAPAVSRRCRVHFSAERFVTAQGEDRVSRAIAYFHYDFPLGLRDKLTLEDGTAPKIERIDARRDTDGTFHHYRVWF